MRLRRRLRRLPLRGPLRCRKNHKNPSRDREGAVESQYAHNRSLTVAARILISGK